LTKFHQNKKQLTLTHTHTYSSQDPSRHKTHPSISQKKGFLTDRNKSTAGTRLWVPRKPKEETSQSKQQQPGNNKLKLTEFVIL
jgi:hypothetical protein